MAEAVELEITAAKMQPTAVGVPKASALKIIKARF